jgi:hypothetical protein
VVVPLAVLGYGVYLVLGLSNPTVTGPTAFGLDDAVWVLGQVTSAIVGTVIASRRPDLPIGWLYRAEHIGLKHVKGSQELVDTYRIRWADTAPQLLKG